jgi:hypothetical protein
MGSVNGGEIQRGYKRIVLCVCHHIERRHRDGSYECLADGCDCAYFTFGGVLAEDHA